MKKMKLFAMLALALCLGAGAAGCDTEDDDDGTGGTGGTAGAGGTGGAGGGEGGSGGGGEGGSGGGGGEGGGGVPQTLDVEFTASGFQALHDGLTLSVAVVDSTGFVVEVQSSTIDSEPMEFTFVQAVTEGEDYTVDYFVDVNANSSCDAPPTDHAWREPLEDVSGPGPVEVSVTHTATFTDVCTTFAGGRG